MAPASGVSANPSMRNSRTATGQEGASKSGSKGLSTICHVSIMVYKCVWIKVGISQRG